APSPRSAPICGRAIRSSCGRASSSPWFLLAAKIINILVPFFYKGAVDALSGTGIAVVPVALILFYGLARVMALGFNELRDAVFAKVGQRAVRRVALSVFRHLHSLSLRFHLDRRTGGLARAVERGT